MPLQPVAISRNSSTIEKLRLKKTEKPASRTNARLWPVSPSPDQELSAANGMFHLSILLLPFVGGLFDLTNPVALANSIELSLVHFLFHELKPIIYSLPILIHMVEPVFETVSLILSKTKSKTLMLLFHIA